MNCSEKLENCCFRTSEIHIVLASLTAMRMMASALEDALLEMQAINIDPPSYGKIRKALNFYENPTHK